MGKQTGDAEDKPSCMFIVMNRDSRLKRGVQRQEGRGGFWERDVASKEKEKKKLEKEQ